MKITYAINPDDIKYELSDTDVALMRERIKTEELYEVLGDVVSQKRCETYDWDWFEKVEADIERTADELVVTYQEFLKESHGGDCLKISATCMRCYVEGLMGLETTPKNFPFRTIVYALRAEPDWEKARDKMIARGDVETADALAAWAVIVKRETEE